MMGNIGGLKKPVECEYIFTKVRDLSVLRAPQCLERERE